MVVTGLRAQQVVFYIICRADWAVVIKILDGLLKSQSGLYVGLPHEWCRGVWGGVCVGVCVIAGLNEITVREFSF